MTAQNNNLHLSQQIDDGEDDELSMVDVLNEQARLQADADAVLGGSDANDCTYPQGRIKRQALYACATCTPEGNAGICLACSYACHEGHDLYELYTKRYFTCDCGNDKFGGRECKLYKGTKGLNADNYYNQNFKGVYCSCARPYPDPDDSMEDEMLQCIVCEDWHHGRHLKATVPEDFHEMICSGCMSKYAFLWAYNTPRPAKSSDDTADNAGEVIDVCDDSDGRNSDSAVQLTEVGETKGTKPHTKDDTDCTEPAKVDTKCTEPHREDDTECTEPHTKDDISCTEPIKDDTKCAEPQTKDNSACTEPQIKDEPANVLALDSSSRQIDFPRGSRKRQAADNTGTDLQVTSPKKVKTEAEQQQEEIVNKKAKEESDDNTCRLKSLQKSVTDCPDSATFWPEGWRSRLCQCVDCLQMYKEKAVEFLTDESDTVRAYEEKGRDSASNMSVEDTTATALAGMDRVQQIEVVRGFMDLKTELNGFLHGFAQNGKVVTETDIREFFQHMDQRRKERMHVSQYTCR